MRLDAEQERRGSSNHSWASLVSILYLFVMNASDKSIARLLSFENPRLARDNNSVSMPRGDEIECELLF